MKWERKFVGFKDNTPEDEVKEKFREKISEYLQTEFDRAIEDADVLQEALESEDDFAAEKTLMPVYKVKICICC